MADLTSADEIAYPVEGRLQWWRGPAKQQGEYVVLDRALAERYWLDTQSGADADLAFELAKVDSVKGAIQFVRTWGPLATGPESGRATEEVSTILSEAQRVHAILTMYADLLGFVQEGGLHPPLSKWRPVLESLGLNEQDADPPLLADITAGLVNQFLGEVPLAVTVNPAFGSPGVAPFSAAIGATDLRGYVYFHVATLLMDGVPTRTCEVCGHAYQVKHPKQRYCSEQCGTRARQRRFAERRNSK